MSSPVKLASGLPGGDANGLAAHSAALTDDPQSLRVVIAIVDVKELKTSIDTGEVTPVLRIRRVELVPDGDLRQARMFFRRANEARTGRTALPIDVEEELDAAFTSES